jgi:hypothetical protein
LGLLPNCKLSRLVLPFQAFRISNGCRHQFPFKVRCFDLFVLSHHQRSSSLALPECYRHYKVDTNIIKLILPDTQNKFSCTETVIEWLDRMLWVIVTELRMRQSNSWRSNLTFQIGNRTVWYMGSLLSNGTWLWRNVRFWEPWSIDFPWTTRRVHDVPLCSVGSADRSRTMWYYYLSVSFIMDQDIISCQRMNMYVYGVFRCMDSWDLHLNRCFVENKPRSLSWCGQIVLFFVIYGRAFSRREMLLIARSSCLPTIS